MDNIGSICNDCAAAINSCTFYSAWGFTRTVVRDVKIFRVKQFVELFHSFLSGNWDENAIRKPNEVGLRGDTVGLSVCG